MEIRRCSILFGFFVFATTLSTAGYSEERSGAADDQIELTRALIQTQRKAVVANNMQFSQRESKAFWPVYNDYRASMNKVNDRQVQLLKDYAASYVKNDLTDKQAQAMLKEFLSIKKARLKLQETYINKFNRVLPPKKVVRYYQLDNKMNAMIDANLAVEVPLVK